MHFASAHHLLTANNRNVIFALASHHTRCTTYTRTQVNRHPPLMDPLLFQLIKRIRIERQCLDGTFLLFAGHLFGEVFVLRVDVMVVIRFTDNRPAFKRPMVLGANEFMGFTRCMERCASGKSFIRCRPQRIGIISHISSDPARYRTTVPQCQTKRVIRKARLNPYWALDYITQ